ncbi:uncharacterized protein TNIN_189371 [Trichonephila inaurata madagascariensis]|uniref:CCHC-type domain-containing protein n=1 Tax=Trichonephila inaurata madagascariensis TaxID=2747483 RepID=A0A8X7BQW7_9ARAC|nr:uncharacterized protein TNIN_189371 [Trichonephila inaurata madagascariensis]
MVESCLPAEILRAWERYVGYSSDESGKKDLDSLMKFLSIEVSSEDRIKLARNSFDSEKFNYKKKLGNISTTATAADLFNSNFKNRKDFKFKNSNDNCIFCEKTHASENCCEAASMLYDKKNAVIKRGVCYICLKRGHMSHSCRSDVKCIICNKRHYAVLCSKLPLRSGLETESASVENSTTASSSSSNVLANQACTSEVLLQTLVVVLQNGNHKSLVRALIDTGSQKSYILKSTAEKLAFKNEGEEEFIHSLAEQNMDVLNRFANVQKNVSEAGEGSSRSHTLTDCSESNDATWESFGSVEVLRSSEFSRESFSTDQHLAVPSMILDENDLDDFCFRRSRVADSTEIERPKVFAEDPVAFGTPEDFCFRHSRVANSTEIERPKVFTEDPDAFGTPDDFCFRRSRVANSTEIERPKVFAEEPDAFGTPEDFCFRHSRVANSTEIERPKVFTEDPDAFGTPEVFNKIHPKASSTLTRNAKTTFTEVPSIPDITLSEKFDDDEETLKDLEEYLKCSSPVEKIQFSNAETFFQNISISEIDMSFTNCQKVHEKERDESNPNSTSDFIVRDPRKSVRNQSDDTNTDVSKQSENVQNISEYIHSAKQINLPGNKKPCRVVNPSKYKNQNEDSDIDRSENSMDDGSDGKYLKDLPKSLRFSQKQKYIRGLRDIRTNNEKHLQHLKGLPICPLADTEPAPSRRKVLTWVIIPDDITLAIMK